MTRSAAVGVSRTDMRGNKTCRKLHSPKDSARETYDASHPRASCVLVGIGLQHEVIAAHSSRWPFGAELLRSANPKAHGQIAADHVTHGSLL